MSLNKRFLIFLSLQILLALNLVLYFSIRGVNFSLRPLRYEETAPYQTQYNCLLKFTYCIVGEGTILIVGDSSVLAFKEEFPNATIIGEPSCPLFAIGIQSAFAHEDCNEKQSYFKQLVQQGFLSEFDKMIMTNRGEVFDDESRYQEFLSSITSLMQLFPAGLDLWYVFEPMMLDPSYELCWNRYSNELLGRCSTRPRVFMEERTNDLKRLGFQIFDVYDPNLSIDELYNVYKDKSHIIRTQLEPIQ